MSKKQFCCSWIVFVFTIELWIVLINLNFSQNQYLVKNVNIKYRTNVKLIIFRFWHVHTPYSLPRLIENLAEVRKDFSDVVKEVEALKVEQQAAMGSIMAEFEVSTQLGHILRSSILNLSLFRRPWRMWMKWRTPWICRRSDPQDKHWSSWIMILSQCCLPELVQLVMWSIWCLIIYVWL